MYTLLRVHLKENSALSSVKIALVLLNPNRIRQNQTRFLDWTNLFQMNGETEQVILNAVLSEWA